MATLTQNTIEELLQIEQQQKELKQTIESYQKDDWDKLYGQTGLWRKLENHLQSINQLIAQVRIFQAMVSNAPPKKQLLEKAIQRLNQLEPDSRTDHTKLLKARALLLQTPSNKKNAEKLLSEFKLRSDTSPGTFMARALDFEFRDDPNRSELSATIKTMAKNNYPLSNDIFLIAHIQRQKGYIRDLRKTFNYYPQAGKTAGRLILDEIRKGIKTAEKYHPYEIELTAEYCRDQQDPNAAKLIIEKFLSLKKFNTPKILYHLAAALSQDFPDRSLKLLSRAVEKSQNRPSYNKEYSTQKIASDAAKLAFSAFQNNNIDCNQAIKPLQSYYKVSGQNAESQLLYYYANVLSNCGRINKSRNILSKLATKSGRFALLAKFALIKMDLSNIDNHPQLITRLKKLIKQADKTNPNIAEQSRLLLARLKIHTNDSPSTGRQIIKITDSINQKSADYFSLRARAFSMTNQPEKAFDCLDQLTRFEDSSYASEGLIVLKSVLKTVEIHQNNVKIFPKMLKKMQNFSEFCRNFKDFETFTPLLAEVYLIDANGVTPQPDRAEKLLNSLESDQETIELIRCRSRLYMTRKDYKTAAENWAKMQNNLTKKEYQWWQAKYYELYCVSKLKTTSADQILHSIEVLKAENSNIPQPWTKKINQLQEQISQTLSNSP